MMYGLTAAAILAMSVPAIAEEAADAAVEETAEPEVFETEDGVLSIEAPTEDWKVVEDEKHWFAMTDGDDLITIDHLSNGEVLPAVDVADEEYGAVYHAFVSTKNEVFIVKGAAVEAENLEGIMRSIGTVKILKFDTKEALEKKEDNKEEFGFRPIGKDYYVTAESLNVRAGCSANDARLGSLTKGTKVYVKGAVTKDGKDIGWMQISFKGSTAYVSAQFLSDKAPEAAPAVTPTPAAEGENPPAPAVVDTITIWDAEGNAAAVYQAEPGPYGWRDQYDTVYMSEDGFLFQNTSTGVFFAAQEGWLSTQEEMEPQEEPAQEEPTEEPEAEPAPAENPWITFYGQDGQEVEVQMTEDEDIFVDHDGVTYERIEGKIFRNTEDDTIWAAEAEYWDEVTEE